MESKYPVINLRSSNWYVTAAMKINQPQWYSIKHPHNYALTMFNKVTQFIITWNIPKVDLNN